MTEPVPYFDVIRRGLQVTPIPVRFGKCFWQGLEGGRPRYLVVLVSPERDSNEPEAFVGFNEPEMSRVMEAVVRQQERIDVLTQALQTAGISVSEPVPFSQTEESVRFRQFEKVRDLDAFW